MPGAGWFELIEGNRDERKGISTHQGQDIPANRMTILGDPDNELGLRQVQQLGQNG